MVFDYFPYLQGEYLTYTEYFAVLLFIYTALPSLGLVLLGYAVQVTGKTGRWVVGKEGCYWLGTAGMVLAVDVLGMFDYIAVPTAISINFLLFSLRFYLCYSNYFPSLSTAFHSHPRIYRCLLVFALLFSVLTPVLTSGLCICIYSPHIGPFLTPETNITTRFLRLFTYYRPCTARNVCHVYLTTTENPASFLYINAQTSPQVPDMYIHYGTTENSLYLVQPMQRFALEGLDWMGERDVHSALLPYLKPATRYFFRLYFGSEIASEVYSFHTLPSPSQPLPRPLRVLIGGDSGSNTDAYQTSKVASTLHPDLIILGGDVAYDNAMNNCYESWDRFLDMVQTLWRGEEGDLVPIVLGIGNHDVGLNAFSKRKLTPDASGPMFYSMFPQHFSPKAFQVPAISSRLSYFHLLAGPCLFLLLDTGYMTDYTGAQLSWLNSTLSNHTSIPYKFAVYHQPIYGSSTRPDYDVMPVVQGLYHWVPLFDYYSLSVGFENHIHSLKRTKPLKGSRIVDKGTVYVGDGQWGTPDIEHELDGVEDWMEVKKKENHFWLVEISATNASVTAYSGRTGEVLDQFHLPSSHPVHI